MRYVVARYYFDTIFKEQAAEDFVSGLFNATAPLEANGLTYAVGNVELEEHQNYKFIRGTLGRLRSDESIDVYNKDARTFEKQDLAEVADRLAEFLIEPSTHLIFIQEDYELKPHTVINKLMKIYANASQLGTLKVDFVLQEGDVYEALKRWDKVRTIKFRDLRPTNPSSKDSFKEIEDMLKETGSVKTDITFHAPPKKDDEDEVGLNYDSQLIRQPLALASHGYGNAKLEGEENGKRVEVKTQKFVRRVEVDFTKDGALERIVQEVEEIQADTNEEE